MDLISLKNRFDSPEFEQQFHCDVPLGASCSPEGTSFRLWAPTAEAVSLRLYDNGTDGHAAQVIPMKAGGRGLWSYDTRRDLHGTYYRYEVTVDGISKKTADPYARSCGINGKRSMVLDLRRTDPEGWQQDQAPAAAPDNVICEIHVKDFSWDPAGGFDPADRGRFTALTREGTTLNGDGIHPTGLDWLKGLGITHVQLLPVYDYGSVDETASDDLFNWGYDPVNYNCPEGSYSTDPYHGEVRVRELKEAVMALHRAGIRVIMDVVYNHTYKPDSCLMRTVPHYYYRQKWDGTLSNGSGCGNEIASERSMCAKYILDSVLYWAEEYHMDGFRFDLMGLLDRELMGRIRSELDRKFGPGEKLLYGEPWYAEPGSPRPGTVLCTKDSLKELPSHLGAFCDNTRDAVKGNLSDPGHRGMVNGGGLDGDTLYRCLTGWAAGPRAVYTAPSQTVNYLSCHDDWTLWDKLILTLDEQRRFEDLHPEAIRANRMAATLLFFCQGHIFFLSGEEFGRTKGGIKNSYCSPPSVNHTDWQRAWDNRPLADHYRGLIDLRMVLPALQDKSPEAFRRVCPPVMLARNCLSATVLQPESPHWSKLLLLCNGDTAERELPLPPGLWQILADDRSTFRRSERLTARNALSVPACSAWILGLLSD